MGRGTGLGLSMVYGIIKQSGGSISVFSTPGEGTKFTLLLPVLLNAMEIPAPAAGDPTLTAGNETVLLVEDDEPVRRFIRKVLTDPGVSALTQVQTIGQAIRIVVCDGVMPEMGGKELSERCS